MVQEVYIDLVFVTNLIMDLLLLRLLGRLLHQQSSWFDCFQSACLGALGACLFLILPVNHSLLLAVVCHGALGVAMVRIAYCLHGMREVGRAAAILYLAAFLIGGFWNVVFGEEKAGFGLFLLFAASTYGGLNALLTFQERFFPGVRKSFSVTLSYRGMEHTFRGFYDTGNLLRDSPSGKPVSVITMEAAEKLFSCETAKKLTHMQEEPGELEDTVIGSLKPHFLPFGGIGQSGILLAVTIDKMCIHAPGKVWEIIDPILAVALQPYALGKDYQVILNSELMQ